jgi:hypothetical protein
MVMPSSRQLTSIELVTQLRIGGDEPDDLALGLATKLPVATRHRGAACDRHKEREHAATT